MRKRHVGNKEETCGGDKNKRWSELEGEGGMSTSELG